MSYEQYLIPISECLNPGDTAWLLISGVLVGGMLPGLAFFESGMLPKKNAMNIVVQILVTLGIIEVMWQVFTFSLTFGPDHGGWIGDFSFVFFHNLENSCMVEHAPTTPAISFALFQLMFATIAPLLISGAVAGRMKLHSFLIFTVWWHLTVYIFVAHWIWGGGFLQQLGAQDFAYVFICFPSNFSLFPPHFFIFFIFFILLQAVELCFMQQQGGVHWYWLILLGNGEIGTSITERRLLTA